MIIKNASHSYGNILEQHPEFSPSEERGALTVTVRRKTRSRNAEPRKGDVDYYFDLELRQGTEKPIKGKLEPNTFSPTVAADYLEMIERVLKPDLIEFDSNACEVRR